MKKALLSLILIILLNTSCTKPAKQHKIYKERNIVFLEINPKLSINEEYDKNFKNGVKLALEEINRKGGVNNKKVRVIISNSNISYLSSKQDLYKYYNSNVLAAFGTYFTQSALGVASVAGKFKIPFLASGAYTNSIIYETPNDYTYRLNPGIYQNIKSLMLRAESISNLNRWMIITYSNKEGKYITKTFKQLLVDLNNRKPRSLKEKNKVTSKFFVREYQVAPFKTSQFISLNKSFDRDLSMVKAVLIAVDGYDIAALINNTKIAQKLLGKRVFLLFGGEPEWLDYNNKSIFLNNWITTGYPWYALRNRSHIRFYKKYWYKYKLKPRYSALLGYISIYTLVDAAKKTNFRADSIYKLRENFNTQLAKVQLNTPLGFISMQPDHQTNMGVYTGLLYTYQRYLGSRGRRKIILKDIRMRDIKYFSFKDISMTLTESLQLRGEGFLLEKQKYNDQLPRYNMKNLRPFN